MANLIRSITDLTQDDKRRVSRMAGWITVVTTHLPKSIESFDKSKFKYLVDAVAPWASAVVDSLEPIAPPLKVLKIILDKLTKETDPLIIGHLASTMAYEGAVKRALDNSAGPNAAYDEARAQLATLNPDRDVDMGSFDLQRPFDHEFTRRAEERFQVAAIVAGYSAAQIQDLTAKVRDHFSICLDKTLSDGEIGVTFAPFREYLNVGGVERRRAFLGRQRHLGYQRWLYEEAPVLGQSPFALQHIYVETDCGILTWGQINQNGGRSEIIHGPGSAMINPFNESEKCGGRHTLLKTVMDLIADPELKETFIVIQGIAGAGKSSFTLRLCSELQSHQLRPIWVRLKELDLTRNITDALPAALRLSEEERASDDLLEEGAIFSEPGLGRFDKISRYVLILDGWDEISVADEGLQKRVNRMLEQVQQVYLKRGRPSVRVILTGRPATEVTESAFFLNRTPILTVRPLHPNRLSEFIQKIAKALIERPVNLENENVDDWPTFDPRKLNDAIEQYSKEFDRLRKAAEESGQQEAESDRLAVLGLPLLSYLTLRVLSEWKGESSELTNNPTTLYRNLVNLTCDKGGKAHFAQDGSDEMRGQHRIVGHELRALLQQTAAAMSALGRDIISYEELSARLRLVEETLQSRVSRVSSRRSLSSLMISFYFKGGFEHLGCEFVHKSFREYLFAESIVEALKTYGHQTAKYRGHLRERDEYWRDFEKDDPRYELSRRLAGLLAPRWLKPEVVSHIEKLLEWEIDRTGEKALTDTGVFNDPLDLAGWCRVREGLIGLWEWWSDRAHLRPQAEVLKRKVEYRPPFVLDLIEDAAPLAGNDHNPKLGGTTSMDAHLGDGLCRLVAWIHVMIANVSGWVAPGENESSVKALGQICREVESRSSESNNYQSVGVPSVSLRNIKTVRPAENISLIIEDS